MPRLVARAILRTLLKAKGRILGVVALVAVSITVYSGTHIGISRIERTTQRIYQEQHLFQLEFRTDPQERITVSSTDELKADLPEIERATWRLSSPGSIEVRGTTLGMALWGIESKKKPEVGEVKIVSGLGLDPKQPERVVLDRTFADDHRIEVGDPVILRMQGFVFHVFVGGIGIFPEMLMGSVDDHMTIPVRGTVAAVLVSTELLKRVIGGSPINSLAVTFKPGTDRESARQRIEARLAKDDLKILNYAYPENHYSVWCHANRIKTFRDFLPTVIFVFDSLIFLVLMLLVQRVIQSWRKEIATLLAFGASPGSVIGAWFLAVGVVTVAGALIGTAGAFSLAGRVAQAYAKGMGFPILYPHFDWWPLAQSWVGAFAVIVPAILLPVVPATRGLPAQMLRESPAAAAIGAVGLVRSGLRAVRKAASGRRARDLASARVESEKAARVTIPYPERIGLLNVLRRPGASLVTALSIAGTIVVASCMYLFAEGQGRGFRTYLASQRYDALVRFNASGDGTDFFNRELTFETIGKLFAEVGANDWEPIFGAEGQISVPGQDRWLAHTIVAYPAPTRMRGEGGMYEGRFIREDGKPEVVIDLRASTTLGLGVGDQVRVRVGGFDRDLEIVGIMNAFSINQTFISPGTLEAITGKALRIQSAVVTGIDAGAAAAARANGSVVGAATGEASALTRLARRSEIATVMPVRLIAERAAAGNEVLGTFVRIYGHLGAFVGAILILVVLGLNIVERAGEYALLRGFGLSAREFARGLAVEIALTALVAAVIAYPFAQLGTWIFQRRIMEVSVWVPIDHSIPTWLMLAAPGFAFMFLTILPAIRMVMSTSEAEVLRARAAG